MAEERGLPSSIVTALVPSLSKSLAEQFNVFRVMHHGTHEKQLSNVFAWLLDPDATHDFGDAFQAMFVAQVNRKRPEVLALPAAGYRVLQEVDTAGPEGSGRDIADIVLLADDACLVIENFESSDGHGHGYDQYRTYGEAHGTHSVVVLLCPRHEPNRQTNGWEQAVVVTYADVLDPLKRYIAADSAWQRRSPGPLFFVNQMLDHFVEGARAVDIDDSLAFLQTMCDTGESERFGHRPQVRAADEFANLVAQHAKRQFEDGRRTLAEIKKSLKQFADRHLLNQLDGRLGREPITAIETKFVGKWEWCVTLRRPGSLASIYLQFGPTAVVQNSRATEPLLDPDYSKVFVTRQATEGDGVDRIVQTTVTLKEVLDGLAEADTRLRDAVLTVARP